MSGSVAEIAGWGGRGHLRASHADREQAVGALKAAFVAGMLAKDEFDARMGQVLASRTYAELAGLTADLLAGLAQEESKPARPRGGQPLVCPSQVITGATMVYASAWLYAPRAAAPALIVLGGFFYLCVLAIAVAVVFENRPDKRSGGGQLPRRDASAPGRMASRLLPPVDLGGQLSAADRRDRHAA